ncbi:MAG: hypothetical protein FJ304_00860 [Planctomycetes bacterium]|nr:hypothetical protein [Planctomycetota bacterium]
MRLRRKLLGVGLAALVGGTATGQFASDRLPAAPVGAPKGAPSLPGGLTPVGPVAPAVGGYQPRPVSPTPPTSPGSLYGSPPAGGAYVPPSDAPRGTYGTPSYGSTYGSPAPAPVRPAPTVPVNIEIPTALPKEHPWLLKPEHGPYFIMVKSYVRPAADSKAARDARERGEKGLTARELAEALASEIRDTYRVQAFLFEYISEERKAEMRAYIAARQKAETEYVAQIEALRQKAKLQGLDFVAPDNKFRVMKHDGRDQIGVLVGGFQSEADALKALTKLKTWPTPKNEVLADKGLILTTKDGRNSTESAVINPYASAFVVPNPSVVKAAQPGGPRTAPDPFIVRLNADNPYSLFKATKGWTLAVKAFTSPVEIGNKDSDTSLMRKFGLGSKGADVLAAGAEQAETMAKALRAMRGPNGEALNLESFVLHTRNSSVVTVGQFDGPDDPSLQAMKRMLSKMSGRVTEDQSGLRPVMNAPTLFDNVVPIPVPTKQ